MYFDSEQKKRLRRKGERRKMKAYVTVRDVMLVLPVKDTQARKILHNLRRQKNNVSTHLTTLGIFQASSRGILVH